MAMQVVSSQTYTEEDHQTWATLHERQWELVKGRACREFLAGFPKLGLDPKRLPDPQVVSRMLQGITGWTLGDAQNEYLGATEWFEHILECRFPVTNYIRRPHEIEYTPMPDLFHEYFGHLGFFTDQYFADTAQMFGQLYMASNDERQHLEIARLWWFTTEFGLIREDGEVRILGAGLLSSPGELMHALKPETPKYDFNIRHVAETASAPYGYHEQFFIVDSMEHIRDIMAEYAKMEGLKAPVPPSH